MPAGIQRGATRENHISTLLLSRGAAVCALAGGPCSLGWAHFAVAVVVLVIDALHGDWLTIMIVLALRVSNFRYLVRYVRVDEVRTGVGAQSACMLAHEHGSRVCTHRW